MIFKDIMRSDYGKIKSLIFMLLILGIIRNIFNNRYSLLMIIVFGITIDLRNRNIKYAEIFSFSFMMFYILRYVVNYNGHDYNKYVEWFNLPIELLFIVSWLSVLLLYYGFRKKFKGDKSILPFLIIGNTSLQYMSMGVLRNLVAFSLWNLSEFFILIIPIIHISSMVYFTVYYLLIGYENYKWKYPVIVGSFIVLFIIAIPYTHTNFFRVTRYVLKFDYWLENAFYYGNWIYYIIVSSTILPVYWINKRKIDAWMFIYCFMFVYIYHFNFMIRMVYISFFAISQLIMKLDQDDFIENYLMLLSVYYLTGLVP